MTDSMFKPGDLVDKVGGRYGGPGRVVGATEALDAAGYCLFNVAHRSEGGYGEFVHVFPASMLRKRAPSHREDEILRLRAALTSLRRQCETAAFNLNQRDAPDDDVIRTFLEIAGQAGRAAKSAVGG